LRSLFVFFIGRRDYTYVALTAYVLTGLIIGMLFGGRQLEIDYYRPLPLESDVLLHVPMMASPEARSHAM
jgi:hypothetical protein